MKEINLDQRRDFGGVLNTAFLFLKQEGVLLIKALLTYTGIPVIGAVALFAYVMLQLVNGQVMNLINSPNPSDILMLIIPAVVLWFLLVIIQILVIAITNGYLKVYHEKGKGNFSISEVGQITARNFFPIIGYGFIISLFVMLGFILFIIPGIYILIVLNFIFIIMFVEDGGLSKNFGRCFDVIKGNWWATFGLLIVTSIIINVVIQVLYIPIQIHLETQLHPILLTGDFSQLNIPLIVTTFVLLIVVSAYLQSFLYLVLGIQYFSLNKADGSNTIIDRINQIGETPNTSEGKY